MNCAVVRKRQCGPHQQGVRVGVKAGELGQTPVPGGCLPSREGDTKTTLAFVLVHAVRVGLQDLAFVLGHAVGVGLQDLRGCPMGGRWFSCCLTILSIYVI